MNTENPTKSRVLLRGKSAKNNLYNTEVTNQHQNIVAITV